MCSDTEGLPFCSVMATSRHSTPLSSLLTSGSVRANENEHVQCFLGRPRERESDWCKRVADRLDWTLPNPMLICFCIWAVDPPDVYHNNPIDCPPITQGQMKPIGCGDHVVSVKPWERPFWLWLSYFWNIL